MEGKRVDAYRVFSEQAYKNNAITQRGALNMFKVALWCPHYSKLSSLKLNKVYKLSVWIDYWF